MAGEAGQPGTRDWLAGQVEPFAGRRSLGWSKGANRKESTRSLPTGLALSLSLSLSIYQTLFLLHLKIAPP